MGIKIEECKNTILYPISNILDILESTQEKRVKNDIMSNKDLNIEIKRDLKVEFNKYYLFNLEIVSKNNYYLSFLKKSYKILMEIVEIEHIKTLKKDQSKKEKIDLFIEVIWNIYSSVLFKKKKKLF